MAAITWQNINTPSFDSSNRAREMAGKNFDAAFGGLEDIVKRRQALDTANYAQGGINNTNAFLNSVQEAKTPEEFAAREGMLREQLRGYGAQVDPVAARAALDGRMATLQQRGLANQQYTDAMQVVKDKPHTELIKSFIESKDYNAAENMLGGLALGNKPALYAALNARKRRETDETQKDTKFTFDQADEARKALMAPLDIRAKEAAINASYAQAEQSRAQATHAKQLASTAKALGSAETLARNGLDAAYKDSIYAGGDYNTGKGKTSFVTGLKALGFSKAQTEDTLAELGKQFPKGLPIGTDPSTKKEVFAPIPVDFLMEMAANSEDNAAAQNWLGWSRRGDNLTNLMSARLKDPDFIQQLNGGMALRNKLIYEPLNTSDGRRLGAHLPPPRTEVDDQEEYVPWTAAQFDDYFKRKGINNHDVVVAPSLKEQRLLRERQ